MKLLERMEGERARLADEAAEREQRIGRDFDLDDCFVSVWANDLNRSLRETQIGILRNGGTSVFRVLVDPATGREVPHRVVNGQWGPVAVTQSGMFVGLGDRAARNKGLVWEAREFPAWAKLQGSGNGLAGMTSVMVAVIRCANNPCDCESETDIEFYRPW